VFAVVTEHRLRPVQKLQKYNRGGVGAQPHWGPSVIGSASCVDRIARPTFSSEKSPWGGPEPSQQDSTGTAESRHGCGKDSKYLRGRMPAAGCSEAMNGKKSKNRPPAGDELRRRQSRFTICGIHAAPHWF